MRFSPNPNAIKPLIYNTEYITDDVVGMYEYIHPDLCQRPYFIIHMHDIDYNTILKFLKSALDQVLSKPYSIVHEHNDDTLHVVIEDIFHPNGILANEFHHLVLSMIPPDLKFNFMENKHNARLYPRYVKLFRHDMSVMSITGCVIQHSPIEQGWSSFVLSYLYNYFDYPMYLISWKTKW